MRCWLRLFLIACCVAHGAAAPFTREIYVWQRQPSAELTRSLRTFAPQADAICVLAAEVGWKGGRMTLVRPAVDFAMLASLQRPVGLALRIGAFPGPFATDDATATTLVSLARELLMNA